MDYADMEDHFRGGIRTLIFCSPHNPTGRVWERGELEAEKLSALTLSRVPGGKQPVGVSGGWTSPTELKARICFVRSPAIVDVILDCGGDAVSVRTECQLFKRYRHPAEK